MHRPNAATHHQRTASVAVRSTGAGGERAIEPHEPGEGANSDDRGCDDVGAPVPPCANAPDRGGHNEHDVDADEQDANSKARHMFSSR